MKRCAPPAVHVEAHCRARPKRRPKGCATRASLRERVQVLRTRHADLRERVAQAEALLLGLLEGAGASIDDAKAKRLAELESASDEARAELRALERQLDLAEDLAEAFRGAPEAACVSALELSRSLARLTRDAYRRGDEEQRRGWEAYRARRRLARDVVAFLTRPKQEGGNGAQVYDLAGGLDAFEALVDGSPSIARKLSIEWARKRGVRIVSEPDQAAWESLAEAFELRPDQLDPNGDDPAAQLVELVRPWLDAPRRREEFHPGLSSEDRQELERLENRARAYIDAQKPKPKPKRKPPKRPRMTWEERERWLWRRIHQLARTYERSTDPDTLPEPVLQKMADRLMQAQEAYADHLENKPPGWRPPNA